MAWQPIETAPMDETLVLAITHKGEMEITQSRNIDRPSFTHWMFLPDPPETK